MALSEVYLSVPMPEALAKRLRLKADHECNSMAATARRLIALGIAREVPAHVETKDESVELAGAKSRMT
jgi:hypothetical protein